MTADQRKRRLLTEKVQRFLRSDNPVAKKLRKLAGGDWRTFLFGGTVREILLDEAAGMHLDVTRSSTGKWAIASVAGPVITTRVPPRDKRTTRSA